MPKILIVDDEERIGIMYKTHLEKQGYSVKWVSNGPDALTAFFNDGDFDLVLLDVMMPEMDGYEVCKEIKANSNTPVIILTAKDSDDDELEGLNCGADDYISKLSSLKVVQARIEKILKQYNIFDKDILEAGDIKVDLTEHKAYLDGEQLGLTLKEYGLLVFFMKNPNQALSRETILKNVWDYNFFEDSRTLDTHIKKIRKMLGPDRPYIKTIWGVGYRFEPEPQEE